ncbi:MAG: hypothetical protein KME10_15555 [Plectolyngbya sp. WJT66-NPBG17]|jgi:hypothetical protein|nr:hypothetical protein [Plectolyngbya sp. WJT66-NPBG17]MBW4524392.1 hypothetical protein [Phormidium tanganyikae FI6-MK23]
MNAIEINAGRTNCNCSFLAVQTDEDGVVSSFLYHIGLLSGVQPRSSGNAASILLETQQLNLLNGGYIATSALDGSTGNGGDLTIRATNILIDGMVKDSSGALSGIQTEMLGSAK